MELFLVIFSIILATLMTVFIVDKPEDLNNDNLQSLFKVTLVMLMISLIISISYIANILEHDKQLKSNELLREKAYECYVENVDEKCFFIYLYPQTEITKNGFILK